MRFARPALAAAAALSLTLLAGCAAPSTPEEQATQEMKNFVAAINGDGDVNWCEGASGASTEDELGGWELPDDAELRVEPWEGEDIWTVYGDLEKTGDPERVETQSIQVSIVEGESACVAQAFGFFA